MALILAVETAQPGTYFFKGSQVNFGVLWAAFSVTTNVLVTALISFQIIHTRQQFQHALESVVDSVDSIQVQSVQIYTGPVAILVESALPYTITGLVWAVVYGKNLVAGPALTFIWGTISVSLGFEASSWRDSHRSEGCSPTADHFPCRFWSCMEH